MHYLPRPLGWYTVPGPKGRWTYSCICPVCLKPWLVIGEPAFHILSIGCMECAYGDEYARHRGISRWTIPGSILDVLWNYLDTTLTRRVPGDHDIIAVLSPAMIQHEFEATLRYYEKFILKETSYVNQDESDPDGHEDHRR